MKIVLLVILIFLIFACSSSTSSNEGEHYGLPKIFPLKVGNAYAYKTTIFNPDKNRILVDTLYISGKHGDSYQMSYHPNGGYQIVKNDQNKLIVLGLVITGGDPDTLIFDKPFIWTFFNIDAGFIKKAEFENYNSLTDSVHISIEYGMEFLTNRYDVYIVRFYDKNLPDTYREQIISVDGLLAEKIYSEGALTSERIIQSKL